MIGCFVARIEGNTWPLSLPHIHGVTVVGYSTLAGNTDGSDRLILLFFRSLWFRFCLVMFVLFVHEISNRKGSSEN